MKDPLEQLIEEERQKNAPKIDSNWKNLLSQGNPIIEKASTDLRNFIISEIERCLVNQSERYMVIIDQLEHRLASAEKRAEIAGILYKYLNTAILCGLLDNNKSLLEVDIGFKLPTGTTFWNDRPYFTGLMRYDTGYYNESDHTFNITSFSKLEWFRDINMYELVNFERIPTGSARTVMDLLFTYPKENAPSALEMTFTTNSPRADIMYSNIEKYQKDVFKLFSSFARQTGSLFGINR